MSQVIDILTDAVIDTLYLIPFLFVTYVAMEWLEHSASHKFQEAIERGGVAGPIIGAVLGVVPQCGFSAAASTFYAARVITLGTLVAVFLSTSDEMLPIFIAEAVPAQTIIGILAAKIVLGMAVGFAVDAVLHVTRPVREHMRIHELCERTGCHCEEDDDAACIESAEAPLHLEGWDETPAPEHDHAHSTPYKWKSIFRSAAKHTAEVTLFVFIVVIALNAVFALLGEDALSQIVNAAPGAAVLVSGLVGLIPNCAASVAIAQLYVDGILSCGAMMSGLLSAAGIGLLVLFRTNNSVRQNLIILAILWGAACVCGFGIDAAGIVF